MTISAIACYVILLLVPAATLLSGLKHRQAAAVPGAQGGFTAEYIPHTPDAWSYTQKLVGTRYILFSILMLVCGVGFMLLMPYADLVSLLCCAGIALGIEIVVLLVGMTSAGMTLQSHFKKASF